MKSKTKGYYSTPKPILVRDAEAFGSVCFSFGQNGKPPAPEFFDFFKKFAENGENGHLKEVTTTASG